LRSQRPLFSYFSDSNYFLENEKPRNWIWLSVIGSAVALWVIALLSSFGPLKALLLGIPLTALGSSSFAEFSNQAVWWQLAARVSEGILFPITPALAEQNQGLAFYPYITLWLHGLAIALIGIEHTALIGSLLLPAVAFLLLTIIYRHFVDWSWAVFLSSLGLLAFSGFPFRYFLFGLLKGKGWMELGQASSLDIVQFPFPALSLVVFAAVFLASIRRIRLSPMRVTVLTLLWGVQAYIHVLNAFVGIIFWLSFIALRLRRQDNNKLTLHSIRLFFTQVVILLAVTSVALIGYFGLLSVGQEAISEPTFNDGGLTNFILIGYLVLPLILLAVLSRIQPIDIFELRTKFLPVWVLIGSEGFLLLVHALLNVGPSAELVSARLGIFFIHPFSFLPVIYYATRPGLTFGRPSQVHVFKSRVNNSVRWFFREASFVYLPLFYVLLTFYVIASALHGLDVAKNTGQNASLTSEKELLLISSNYVKKGGTAVIESPSANLLLPSRVGLGSLWVARFANQSVPKDEAIERLALFARLVGWSEDRFMEFMEPRNQDFSLFSDRIILTNEVITPGVGYWLVHHYGSMNNTELVSYRNKLLNIYSGIDVAQALRRFNVRVLVLSIDRVPSSIPHRTVVHGEKLLITID
jgi:hypothetical protein